MRAPTHLNALRAFEAAARHRSYVTAGEELGVTPAAVGQRVRGLEEVLDVELFHRSRSGPTRLVLTDAALSCLQDLQAGFDHLAAAIEKLTTKTAHVPINAAMPPAFAQRWLLPRLAHFHFLYPNYDLRINTRVRLADPTADRFDVGVEYGEGHWRGLKSDFLLRDDFFPICSPNSVAGKPRPRRAEDLHDLPLIHDTSMAAESSFPTWRTWFRHAGVSSPEGEQGLHIDDPSAIINAATAGYGVALGRSTLIAGDLAEGRLIHPFGAPFGSKFGYYVVHRPENMEKVPALAFRNWLIAEARECREAS